MFTQRLESMSPRGSLTLIRQDDGDVVLTAHEDDEHRAGKIATVEFCTPFAGGGGSTRTWTALVQLMGAMAADNLDARQNGRRPPHINDDEQRQLVEWAEQCRDARKEFDESYKPTAETEKLLGTPHESPGGHRSPPRHVFTCEDAVKGQPQEIGVEAGEGSITLFGTRHGLKLVKHILDELLENPAENVVQAKNMRTGDVVAVRIIELAEGD